MRRARAFSTARVCSQKFSSEFSTISERVRTQSALSSAAARARQQLLRARKAAFLGQQEGAFGSSSAEGAGSKAFAAAELPAVIDLFHDFADREGNLSESRLQKLLAAVGEWPSEEVLQALFVEADTDHSGGIDLQEFLAASDLILAQNPARVTLVVGGPGSGKGLLCSRLVKECAASHISSGDMLREEVAAGTPIGKEVRSIMERGDLVSSELITKLLHRRMRAFGGRRLLLDGFPRSRQNAIDFEQQCGRPELALHLVCPEEIMIERILKRAEIEGRSDDTPEGARQRVEVYKSSGQPTMDWLREKRVPIIELDASGTPYEVWSQLLVVGRLMRDAVAF